MSERIEWIEKAAAKCEGRAQSLEETGLHVLAAEARKCAAAIRTMLPKGHGRSATWRRVGTRAEAELRTRDERSELLQAFLRVGPQWYTRETEDDEWAKCAPNAVPVRVAELLRGVP